MISQCVLIRKTYRDEPVPERVSPIVDYLIARLYAAATVATEDGRTIAPTKIEVTVHIRPAVVVSKPATNAFLRSVLYIPSDPAIAPFSWTRVVIRSSAILAMLAAAAFFGLDLMNRQVAYAVRRAFFYLLKQYLQQTNWLLKKHTQHDRSTLM